MKPTNNLRWLKKANPKHGLEDNESQYIFTLQQWWEYEPNGWLQLDGEWRDVLVEVEK